jgi:predicted Rossmann-fold nucleotide-binding protein
MLQRETTDVDRRVVQIAEEFRAGFDVVARIDRPAVAVFGSARLPETDRWCTLAVEAAAGFAREGFAVVTGGGPGLMEAANRGAQQAGGLSVASTSSSRANRRRTPTWTSRTRSTTSMRARRCS